MDTPGIGGPGNGMAAMRRGSCDDAAASLRPHLRSLAQRRRSAPSLAFGKALGMHRSPIREETSCWVSAEQCPFVLGLSSQNGELLLEDCVQVTEGNKTRERHLFLFRDVIVFAKLKSTASYRLKHTVSLEHLWLYGFDDEPEDEAGGGDIDLRTTLILAWALTFCMLSFRSPEVKERWLDTLHRKIKEAKERAGCSSPPPSGLMKVLSCSITAKTLSGGGMEPFIEFPSDGATKTTTLPKQLHNQEDRSAQPIESISKWKILRKLSSVVARSEIKSQLFGQPLCKICPDESSLPKPIMEMLTMLWKKGPSTEGVFRKSGNKKNIKSIRDQINSSEDVNMKDLPVFLLVGLLKSFLNELPGSLLVSGLYDTWIKALETEDPLQKTAEIKRVVDSLPGHNRLLLQHLMSIFRRILESADTNKMDAYNLAVCIAPTLLQLDSTSLDEQKDKLEKVMELTQFLIETCCETLGENILNLLGDANEDNSDSLSSQHHDSAYDSTDPDADADPEECGGSTQGEGGSSPSLLYPSTAIPSCPSNAIFHTFTKPEFNRRCSEPIIFPSAEARSLCSLARSNEDCSLKRRDFEEQPLKKQISDDSFLLQGRGGARPALSFPKLGSNMVTLAAVSHLNPSKDCSCSSSCSLESTASNQSEGSVFTSSPLASPTCPRRAPSIHQTVLGANGRKDIVRTASEKNKRSQSMRGECKIPVRTKSFGAFSFTWGSMKKGDQQKEKPFRCMTLQEDSQREAEPQVEQLIKPRPLSAIEPFQHVDYNVPCRPPSYEQAVQCAGLPAPPNYQSMTVQDARAMGRRSRPTSVNEESLLTCPVNQYQVMQGKSNGFEQLPRFRQRAKSESVYRGHHDALSRRCSQPVFEEISYAKESYV